MFYNSKPLKRAKPTNVRDAFADAIDEVAKANVGLQMKQSNRAEKVSAQGEVDMNTSAVNSSSVMESDTVTLNVDVQNIPHNVTSDSIALPPRPSTSIDYLGSVLQADKVVMDEKAQLSTFVYHRKSMAYVSDRLQEEAVPLVYNFSPLRDFVDLPLFSAFSSQMSRDQVEVLLNGVYRMSEIKNASAPVFLNGILVPPLCLHISLRDMELFKTKKRSEFIELGFDQLNRLSWLMMMAFGVIFANERSLDLFRKNVSLKTGDLFGIEPGADPAAWARMVFQSFVDGFILVDQLRSKWGKRIDMLPENLGDLALFVKLSTRPDMKTRIPDLVKDNLDLTIHDEVERLTPDEVDRIVDIVDEKVRLTVSNSMDELALAFQELLLENKRLREVYGEDSRDASMRLKKMMYEDIQMYVLSNDELDFLVFRLVMNVSSYVNKGLPNVYLNMDITDRIYDALFRSGSVKDVLLSPSSVAKNKRIGDFLRANPGYLDTSFMLVTSDFYGALVHVTKPNFAVALAIVASDIQTSVAEDRKLEQAKGLDFLFTKKAVAAGSIQLLANVIACVLVVREPGVTNDLRAKHRTDEYKINLDQAWRKLRQCIILNRLLG